MNYYDEDFQPWEIVGGQCVIADESQWQKIDNVVDNYFDKLYLHNPGGAKIGERPKRPIVKLTTDIFEEYKGGRDEDGTMYCNHTGEELSVNQNGHVWPAGWPSMSDGDDWGIRSYTIADVLDRFFYTADSTPHVDYLVPTLFPDLINRKWKAPPQFSKGGDRKRSNVILATYVETQSDIERLVPELLKCHDLCKGLAVVCNPKEELDFSDILGIEIDRDGSWRRESKFGGMSQQPVNLIIAEGNEHPIHPDWLRSLREQCLNANVPFHFAGWGECRPAIQGDPVNLSAPMMAMHPSGKVYEDDELLPKGEGVEIVHRVGKDESGRLLDGQEHNGRVS